MLTELHRTVKGSNLFNTCSLPHKHKTTHSQTNHEHTRTVSHTHTSAPWRLTRKRPISHAPSCRRANTSTTKRLSPQTPLSRSSQPRSFRTLGPSWSLNGRLYKQRDNHLPGLAAAINMKTQPLTLGFFVRRYDTRIDGTRVRDVLFVARST